MPAPPFDIVTLLNEERAKTENYPVRANRASQIGNQCLKYLYLLRTNWQDKKSISPTLASIFKEGSAHEKLTIEEIHQVEKMAGVKFSTGTISGVQHHFEMKDGGGELLISGSVDGLFYVEKTGALIPGEIKSMSNNIWGSLKTAENNPTMIENAHQQFLNHPLPYMRGYTAQMMMYLLSAGMPLGLMICKNKLTGLFKQAWFSLETTKEFAYAESLLKKCETINKAVQKQVPPPGINKPSVCLNCDLAHICMPDLAGGGPTLEGLEPADSERLYLLLASYREGKRKLETEGAKEILKASNAIGALKTSINEILEKILPKMPAVDSPEIAESEGIEMMLGADYLVKVSKPYPMKEQPARVQRRIGIEFIGAGVETAVSAEETDEE